MTIWKKVSINKILSARMLLLSNSTGWRERERDGIGFLCSPCGQTAARCSGCPHFMSHSLFLLPDSAVLSFNFAEERGSKQSLIVWEGRLMISFALGSKSYSKQSQFHARNVFYLSKKHTFSQTYYSCR